jgi:hypothetical protein
VDAGSRKTSRIPVGIGDTYEAAKTISEQAPHVAKVAIVCNPEQYKDASFWETVVVNRGLQARACRTIEDAKFWLTSSS